MRKNQIPQQIDMLVKTFTYKYDMMQITLLSHYFVLKMGRFNRIYVFS